MRFRNPIIEALESRQFLSAVGLTAPTTATIQGTVFNDRNANGLQNVGEPGIAHVRVFIDSNHSGVYVNGDPYTFTNSSGAYTFANLKAGAYALSTQPPAGFQQDYPFNGADNKVIVAAGRVYTGYRFGETTTALVGGYVKAPAVGGGIGGVAGATITVSAANGKGALYTATTDSTGHFSVADLPNTSFKVTLKLPSVYVLTSGSLVQTTPVLSSGKSDNNIAFNLTPLLSFGTSHRFVNGSDYIDPTYFPNNGYPAKTETGSIYSTFNGSVNAVIDTGKFMHNGVEDDIAEIAASTQNSVLTPLQISDSGEVTTIGGNDGSSGNSSAKSESFFQTTFTLKTAQHYSLAASYHSLGGEPVTTGSFSLTAQGGKSIASGSGNQSTPISISQSGILAAGTYTITFDITCNSAGTLEAQAAYSLGLKFG